MGKCTKRHLFSYDGLWLTMSVPANMTHFSQPLDLTVNGEAKRFMKDNFSTWYSD